MGTSRATSRQNFWRTTIIKAAHVRTPVAFLPLRELLIEHPVGLFRFSYALCFHCEKRAVMDLNSTGASTSAAFSEIGNFRLYLGYEETALRALKQNLHGFPRFEWAVWRWCGR